MWKIILTIASGLLTLIMRLVGKNKKAEELLPDPTDTEKAKNEANRKAEEKFGPRGAKP